ncbi:ZIP family metal transporter [Evansella halocellulosilytica]|uniref:ZIP family metal transporter n=1 Tax=Evansella halocellulosilytica TaxID=2011013 RepID=UPI000BB95DC5|nr:ZIP family metal transporter [Evansella halocellulosilytica]
MTDFLILSAFASASTGLGAVPALIFQKATHNFRDILLAFCAGVMVSVSAFELIPQALIYSDILLVTIGLLTGVFILTVLEQNIPHIHLDHGKVKADIDEKALLIIAAITLHNLPEGLSVGVSFASGVENLGPMIALAIGLQNLPEGFLVALFLIQQKVNKVMTFFIVLLTGLVEYVSAIAGFVLTSYVSLMVPFGLAFAAGSMLYIVYKELIPESHGDGHAFSATYAFIFGLIGMLWVSSVF